MKYEWIDKYCVSKPKATKDYKEEWGWDRYQIGGKLFCACCIHKNGRPIITVKCDPLVGEDLRNQYEDIVEGYYMNKVHWNSVFLDRDIPNEVIKEMIDCSYELILSSLPKKIQKELCG